jgi:hypothetical protein
MEMPKPKKRKKRVKKNTGLKNVFLEIWEEREHVSELSGKYLGEESNAWFFAHIRSRGSAPHLATNKENIMLLTPEEHTMVDHKTHLAKQDPLYAPFFEKLELLKSKYP